MVKSTFQLADTKAKTREAWPYRLHAVVCYRLINLKFSCDSTARKKVRSRKRSAWTAPMYAAKR